MLDSLPDASEMIRRDARQEQGVACGHPCGRPGSPATVPSPFTLSRRL